MHVVITGASQGIGKAIAEAFAREGAHLSLCSRHMDQQLSWQQALMNQYNIRVSSYNADLSDEEAVRNVAAAILAGSPQVDILVNNAGSFEPGTIHGEPEGQLERMMRVNLYSAYHLTRAFLPSMMARGSGHIFNICSVASLQAYPAGGSYSISKWALLGFSRNLREEMKPHGIKVTSVHPGATMTRSWESSGVPPERIMQVGDIARLVVAAASLSAQACVEDILVRPQMGDL